MRVRSAWAAVMPKGDPPDLKVEGDRNQQDSNGGSERRCDFTHLTQLNRALNLDNALASEGPCMPPAAPEHLGRLELTEDVGDMASQLHFDGVS